MVTLLTATSVNRGVIHLMRIVTALTAGLLTLAIVGCRESATSEVAPPVAESLQPQRPPVPERLQDIGTPDHVKREVDGIQIIGSALTDDHIAAIRAITDDTKPTKPNRYLIRGIEHTGPNAATNTWQTGHSQVYQKLRLANGTWTVDEQGGGFGQW